ncbi:hypothetical protein ASF51_07540 [Agreia sp. Leaf283]|nr:hypothetical protein ASF51_07540 [Agreia sp. Leaf283]
MVAVVVTAGILTGCSGAGSGDDTAGSSLGEPQATAPAAGAGTTPSAEESPTTSGGYPTCDEAKAALGPEVSSLIELEGSDNGITTGVDGPELICSWHTPETDGSSIDVEEYGGISIGISRDPEYTEESMEPVGWTVDVPAVSAAGAWALKVGGGYDPAEQLDITGVQVIRDGVVVVLTSGGVALQDVPQLASLTNEWAMNGGVALLDLVR